MVEFTVTVPGGTGGGYYIDGVQKPVVPVVTGGTFRFNQNDSTNSNHPLILSTTTSTAGIISTGVSYYLDGASNQANYTNTTLFNAATVRYIEITVAETSDFYYLCNVHGFSMGNNMDVTSTTWGALGWNIGEWGNQGDGEVTLTGQSLTALLNSVTPLANANVDVTGQLLTALLNSVTPLANANVDVTGQLLTASLNSVTPVFSVNVDVTGQLLTLNLNSVTIEIILNPVDVTGQLLTASLNSVTPLADANVDVTGQLLTAALNSITISLNTPVDITSQLLTLNLNSVTVEITLDGFANPTGQLLTANLASVDPSPDAIVVGIGMTAELAIGTVVLVTTEVDVIGQLITAVLGSVTPIVNNEVTLTGNILTMTQNNINIQSWTKVNTGTIVTWTEINTAA